MKIDLFLDLQLSAFNEIATVMTATSMVLPKIKETTAAAASTALSRILVCAMMMLSL